jgi:hypothetical protein
MAPENILIVYNRSTSNEAHRILYQLHAQLHAQLRAQLLVQLHAQLRAQLRVQLWVQLQDQFLAQLRDHLWVQLWDQLHAQLLVQLDDCLWHALPSKNIANPVGHFLPLHQAGVAFFFIMDDTALLIPQPSLRWNERLQFHCQNGPAITWQDQTTQYFLQGIEVPKDVIEQPDKVSVTKLISDTNIQRRSVIMSHIGFERILGKVRHSLLEETPEGTLYALHLPRETLHLLKVHDGTNPKEIFYIPASPRLRTVRAVRAASFGKTPEEFVLVGES